MYGRFFKLSLSLSYRQQPDITDNMMRGHINTNHGDIRRRRLPVFVSPEELRFIGDEESSHRQILTIFNPYDFIICFKGIYST